MTEKTLQKPSASLKCRVCEKRYIDMITPFAGTCPCCKTFYEIKMSNPFIEQHYKQTTLIKDDGKVN